METTICAWLEDSLSDWVTVRQSSSKLSCAFGSQLPSYHSRSEYFYSWSKLSELPTTMLLQCSMRQRLRITSPRMKNQSLTGHLSLTFGLDSQFAFLAQFAASYLHKSMSRWLTVKLILKWRRKRASKRLIKVLTTQKTRTERRNQNQAVRRASWTNMSRDFRDHFCSSW